MKAVRRTRQEMPAALKDRKNVPLPHSFETIFRSGLSMIRALAKARGISTRDAARVFLESPLAQQMRKHRSASLADYCDDLTPETEEYRELRLLWAEWLYQASRVDIQWAKKYRPGRQEGADGPLKNMIRREIERRGAKGKLCTAQEFERMLKAKQIRKWDLEDGKIWMVGRDKPWPLNQLQVAVSQVRASKGWTRKRQ